MRRTTKLLFVIGFVIGMQAVAAINLAGSDGVHISDGVPLSSPNGPTVVLYGSTNVSLENATNTNSVYITSEAGNVTVNSIGNTRADVFASNLTGRWTNLTNLDVTNTLTVDPDDKQQVEINGSLSDFSFQNMTINDNTPDFYVNGTNAANITVYSLPQDTKLNAVDQATGTVLDTVNTSASGVGTFELNLSSHTILLQTNQSSTTDTGKPGMPRMVWLFIGLVGLSATGVALSTQTVASASMPDADGIAILSGIIGFLSWSFWSFGSLTVVVATSNGLAQAKMPGLTLLGVALAILCGYIALTGPAEIIASRYKDPRAEDL